MTGIVRHDPVDIAHRALEAAAAQRQSLLTRIIFCHGHPGEADGSVMYRIGADMSVTVLNEDCEAVIENGMITGYLHVPVRPACGDGTA